MAGAMIPGRCVPLRDWPVAPLKTDAAPRTQVRHCWVGGSVEDLGPWPGLVLEWRTDQPGSTTELGHDCGSEHANTLLTWENTA
jgi:hypothetical protein